MCIRAFQYLPPVDVTFSDFLRSAVTADRDLFPADELGLRAALVEGFRKRGIYPDGVSGLADEAVAWPSAAEPGTAAAGSWWRSWSPWSPRPRSASAPVGRAAEDAVELQDRRKGVAKALNGYARKHADRPRAESAS